MSTEYIRYPSNAGGGGGGVTSLNGQTGALTLIAGANITITPGAGSLTIAAASGSTGTVTSVGLSLPNIFSVSGSPVTTSGTLSASLASQAQNLVFASPSGSSGAPSFRSLVSSDIPSLSSLYLNLDASNSPMLGNLLLNPSFQVSTNSACTIGQATTIAATTLSWKEAIEAATLSRLQVNPIYNNGAGGVGATLTSATNVVLPAIDGYSAQVGDRLGIFHETSALKNGIYEVTDLGTAGVSPWILTRTTDADSTAGLDKAAVQPGHGSQTGLIFQQQTASPVVGTDPISFVNILSGIVVADEITLTLTGNVMSLKPLGITNAYVSNSANISWSKLQAGNPNSIAFFDGSGILQTRVGGNDLVMVTDNLGAPSTVATTSTEVSYLIGATSNIQAQINALQPAITPGSIATSTTGVTIGSGANSTIGPNVTVNVQTASGSQPGLISAADWTTFNSKQNALTIGNLTDAGTDGIVITGGSGSVIGSGTSIAQHVSDASHNGYLSSADWSTFNSKQSALSFGNLTDVGTDGITVTGGSGAVIGAGTSISQHVADSTHNGYLSQTDWSAFNSKQSALTFGSVSTSTTGVSVGSGANSTVGPNVTVNVQTASGSQPGLLSSADWTTFNSKQAAGAYITALSGDVVAAGPGSAVATLASTAVTPGSYTYGSFTVNSKGLLTAASSGAAPAPASAQYVTLALDGTLSNERTLAVGSQFNLVDGGANQPVTISPKGPGAYNLIMDDFVDSGLLFTSTVAGTAAAAALTAPTAAMGFANGVAQFTTGTTAAGRACIGMPIATGLSLGNTANSITHESRILIPTLSTGTQRFTIISGFNNIFTGLGTNAACFTYIDNVNGGAFVCRTIAASTATTTNTAVTVATNTWYKLTIAVNAAGTSVVFSINGTVVATHTTNIPTGTNTSSHMVGVFKSVGTSASLMDVDYISVESIWATSR